MGAKNKTIAIKARRAFFVRCGRRANLNATRGASHTDFPKNTLRRECPARYRKYESDTTEGADVAEVVDFMRDQELRRALRPTVRDMAEAV